MVDLRYQGNDAPNLRTRGNWMGEVVCFGIHRFAARAVQFRAEGASVASRFHYLEAGYVRTNWRENASARMWTKRMTGQGHRLTCSLPGHDMLAIFATV